MVCVPSWRGFVVQLGLPRGAMSPLQPASPVAARILSGAKAQQGNFYDASYLPINYPNGDVPNGGACSDVIVRALRNAGFDLQTLMHADMTAHFDLYPHTWKLPAPNTNIDHRRVPNQKVFFKRFGQTLPLEVSRRTLKTWQPGDIVQWNTGRNWHTGIVSDTRNARGEPFVIHNGSVCVEDDCLTRWKITGHFRVTTAMIRN